MPDPSVAILGATGLVGQECVRHFGASRHFKRVHALARRPVEMPAGSSSVESHVIDHDALDRSAAVLRVSHVVCALGTTIRTAGSQAQFRRVDLEYPLAAARLSLQMGARHYLLVSAIGANAESRVFYNRVKGEVENGLRALAFRSVTIVRPSLLLGERDEFRLGERIASLFAPLFPTKYKPVHASDVARALVSAAEEDRPGVRVIESEEIPRGN